jgi:hypothetical protein
MAQHGERKYRGEILQRGELVTSVPTIMKDTKLSEQQTRTCIKRLKSTGEITCKSTNKYTIITICNYDRYQGENSEANGQNNGQTNTQATDKQRTNNGHNNNNNVAIKQCNNNNINNISVCNNSARACEKRERDEIFKIFFLKNFERPAYEVERFYNHYEAQGWERGNGQKITNKIAAARSWEQEDKTKKRFPDAFLQAMQEICNQLSDDDATKVMRAIVKIEIDALNLLLILNDPVMEIIDPHAQYLKAHTGRMVHYATKRKN